MSRARAFYRQQIEAIRARGIDLPDEVKHADILTHVVGDKGCEIGAIWVMLDVVDERMGYLQTVLFNGFDVSDADLCTKENWFANLLLGQRELDEIHLARQSRVIDYRKKGAEFDAKLANVIKRQSRLNDG